MSILIDILGAMVIGSMLILMMFSFQYQLSDTTNSAIYMAGMVEHMRTASTRLNGIVALAGIGFLPENTVVVADTNRLEFKTKWDYAGNTISTVENRLVLTLSNVDTPLGKALIVTQNGTQLNDLGYIFWVDRLFFRYYDIDDAITTDPSLVRSADLWLTFRHNAPTLGRQSLHTKLQMRCYFMNAYLAGG
ncbi:MAG: hypothetical protein Q8M98_04335 [Candidatus Cloacimonadaceae bacterium]|nr:hypothetical protein [Candidatus Cloacimonadaceae bacterium]MDP3113987.1 hypothetical protein [Candidatus Cloacimonadaceae bacterium]